jgi:aquaporin related protein
MQLVGGFSPLRGIIALIMELLGGILAAALVRGLFPGDLQVETVLRSDVSLVRGVFIELILTSELVFVILMLATEKHEGNFIAPVGIGLALFIAELVGQLYILDLRCS